MIIEIIFWIAFVWFGFRLGFRISRNRVSVAHLQAANTTFLPVIENEHLFVWKSDSESPNTELTRRSSEIETPELEE